MLPVILLIVLFFALQLLVLFCCVAAGNDPYSQFLSDEESILKVLFYDVAVR